LFHRKHGQCDLQPLSLLHVIAILPVCSIALHDNIIQPDITSLTSIYPDHISAQNH
jgi:hypothetical protein